MALLTAFGREQKTVDRQLIDEVIQEYV